MRKAILVTFSVTTRLIADVNDSTPGLTLCGSVSDEDFARAYEQAMTIMNQHADSPGDMYESMKEDTECPYDPETDDIYLPVKHTKAFGFSLDDVKDRIDEAHDLDGEDFTEHELSDVLEWMLLNVELQMSRSMWEWMDDGIDHMLAQRKALTDHNNN